jgi:hypothetical protein
VISPGRRDRLPPTPGTVEARSRKVRNGGQLTSAPLGWSCAAAERTLTYLEPRRRWGDVDAQMGVENHDWKDHDGTARKARRGWQGTPKGPDELTSLGELLQAIVNWSQTHPFRGGT